MQKKPLVILTGPTAVGKTDLSISLAKKINGEIISADSVQVYRHMDIGSAKITKEEMQGVPHYLIDEFEPDDEFNIVVFQRLAKMYMDNIYSRGKIPIIVGGTGFYIQALLYDIDFTETDNDPAYREELEILAEKMGNGYLHDLLKQTDPESASIIHENNRKRVIRALEYYKQTGQKISEHNEEQRDKNSPYQAAYFVLDQKRDILYERINQRVELMLKQGLVEEVKTLQKSGYGKELISMQGLGYKEIMEYLEGNCTLEEAVYTLKRDTRHFAKRQITWFKREDNVVWLNYWEFENSKARILSEMLKILNEMGIYRME